MTWLRRRRWCGAQLRPAIAVPELRLTGSQVRRMDLEARSLPVSVKTPLLAKLRDYKARARWHRKTFVYSALTHLVWQTNLMLLKGNLKKAGAAMDGDGGRDELLSRAEAGDTASGAQRDRLLTATDKLKQTGDRIKEGKKTLIEAEDLGAPSHSCWPHAD